MYLYVVKCNEYYKIGVASNVEARLAALQTGNPYELIVKSCFEFDNANSIEQALHQKFSEKQKHGEWFVLNDDDVRQFETICNLLGGKKYAAEFVASEEETEKAEAVGEIVSQILDESPIFDIESMLSAGWRIEIDTKLGGKYRYWYWRKGSGKNRQYTAGGRLENAPKAILDIINSR